MSRTRSLGVWLAIVSLGYGGATLVASEDPGEQAKAILDGAGLRGGLIAGDAFNGVVLWKREIPDWGWKAWRAQMAQLDWRRMPSYRCSSPLSVPRRLVAVGDRVYVTLGYQAPLTALVEFVGLHGDQHSRNNWVRGACRYGLFPCNRLLYSTPHPCFCNAGVKLGGQQGIKENISCP
jgi:hypothetical protein